MGQWRRNVILLASFIWIMALMVTGRYIDEDDDDIEGFSDDEVKEKMFEYTKSAKVGLHPFSSHLIYLLIKHPLIL